MDIIRHEKRKTPLNKLKPGDFYVKNNEIYLMAVVDQHGNHPISVHLLTGVWTHIGDKGRITDETEVILIDAELHTYNDLKLNDGEMA